MLSDYLRQKVHVIVDRPLGSLHPEFSFVYPVNYGYLPNTISADGEEIDAYIVGEFNPLKDFDGVVTAVVHRLDDAEDKLVVSDRIGRYTAEQLSALLEFQERFFQTKLIMA